MRPAFGGVRNPAGIAVSAGPPRADVDDPYCVPGTLPGIWLASLFMSILLICVICGCSPPWRSWRHGGSVIFDFRLLRVCSGLPSSVFRLPSSVFHLQSSAFIPISVHLCLSVVHFLPAVLAVVSSGILPAVRRPLFGFLFRRLLAASCQLSARPLSPLSDTLFAAPLRTPRGTGRGRPSGTEPSPVPGRLRARELAKPRA